MVPSTVHFSGRAWLGRYERRIVRFDFRTNEGKDIRFFAFPEKCVMLAHRPWPDSIAPYTEWYVHLVDVCELSRNPSVWRVEDRQIDIIIEENLRTYRIIDLGDFGEAIKAGQIGAEDADRLLTATQTFLDEYLHGGGRFPPKEISDWLCDTPRPELVTANDA